MDEKKIKSILVCFFREAMDGDYLEALDRAVNDIKTLKEEEPPTNETPFSMITDCVYCGDATEKNPSHFGLWTTEESGNSSYTNIKGVSGYSCAICYKKAKKD